MYPAVWEPLLERRVDHPAWRSLCSVLCMVWSSRVLLTKGVSLTNKRKNHSKTDLPWRRAACVFLLKALTSPVIGRFNSACLTGKKKSGRVKVAQLYPALCDAMDCILPGSSVHGISQARLLEWVAMPFSKRSSPPTSPMSSALQADSLPSEPAIRDASTNSWMKNRLSLWWYLIVFLLEVFKKWGAAV